MPILNDEFATLASLQTRVGRPAIVNLLGHYFNGMRDMKAKLVAMKDSVDIESAKMVAQHMHGACGSLGFQRLAEIFREMDAAADRDDAETIAGLIDAVENESTLLESAIYARFPETNAASSN